MKTVVQLLWIAGYILMMMEIPEQGGWRMPLVVGGTLIFMLVMSLVQAFMKPDKFDRWLDGKLVAGWMFIRRKVFGRK